jgi:pimeloyl-ACP methyl ester carboxylesterase
MQYWRSAHRDRAMQNVSEMVLGKRWMGPGKPRGTDGPVKLHFLPMAVRRLAAILVFAAPLAAGARPPGVVAAEPSYGAELEGFEYPYPARHFAFASQGVSMQMAYLDVAPSAASSPNGRTVVLLHGKNFCAATWVQTIAALVQAGYRVLAPDQIGFCKSTKPSRYQYSFHQLATNTRALLASIGAQRVTLLGHSTGGMLAIRFALMFPEQVEQLVLVNPIGLEDWQAKGVPTLSVDQWYQREASVSAQRIRAYEQATYYDGTWRAEFEVPVQMLAGMYRGPGRELVAWNSALVYDMIFTQPVLYELEQLRAPTLLMIGQRDTTAIGKDLAPAEVAAGLGNYAQLGRMAAARIAHATLVEFPQAGHAPQLQDPLVFHQALLQGLAAFHP